MAFLDQDSYVWRRNNLEPPGKRVRSHHSKLDSTSTLGACNFPSCLKLVQLPAISECVIHGVPSTGVSGLARACMALDWRAFCCLSVPQCLSYKMVHTKDLQGSSPGKKNLLIKAGSWTDVRSVRSLRVVDSEFSLVRRFWSY